MGFKTDTSLNPRRLKSQPTILSDEKPLFTNNNVAIVSLLTLSGLQCCHGLMADIVRFYLQIEFDRNENELTDQRFEPRRSNYPATEMPNFSNVATIMSVGEALSSRDALHRSILHC